MTERRQTFAEALAKALEWTPGWWTTYSERAEAIIAALPNEWNPTSLVAENERLRTALDTVLALHPKIEHPRHGCCAAPASCSPDWPTAFGKGHGAYLALKPADHPPECGGKDHGLSMMRWPCPTVQALSSPVEKVVRP